MTLAAPPPRVLSWCFDDVDISGYFKPADAPDHIDGKPCLTVTLALDLIFGELCHETDRPVRDRLNEALRQWHLRTYGLRR